MSARQSQCHALVPVFAVRKHPDNCIGQPDHGVTISSVVPRESGTCDHDGVSADLLATLSASA